jgi:8-oxo-dGTP pyrophosphatase MutT (NUDIX family)
VAWEAVQQSLRIPQTWDNPHQMTLRIPALPRRAAVAMVLWGDAEGARKLVLVQRGFTAPQHPGEMAFPGGMVEPEDRDLRDTARRELEEELGIRDDLWELGCFPDGIAKARTRFTPVLFRWDSPAPKFTLDPELQAVHLIPLRPLMAAPWTSEWLEAAGVGIEVPRLEMTEAPVWGATAFVLKKWLEVLATVA